jgi:glycosyltransferase involved in cell wall biosynthesis
LLDIAFHNLLATDYPLDKIEWVVVEDHEDSTQMASEKIMNFQVNNPKLKIKYIPIQGRMSIGQKRNLGVENSSNDFILFMDDDDHYPETSIRRRVAWLTKHPWAPKAVGCTTIACYDLLRGVSAVNTPPWDLPLGQRISEATLCFYKQWWQDRHFSFKQDTSEGDDFVKGREAEFLEIPPQQMIVAFSHKKNVSGRRIPADDAKPGCFWGFPKEFLIYIHKLAGVEVEEDKSR